MDRLLTDLDRRLPPQQELEAFSVVRQAAVVQGRAAFPCLFIQVPTGREHDRETKNSESQDRGPGTAWAGDQGTCAGEAASHQTEWGFLSSPHEVGGTQRHPTCVDEAA